MLTSFGDMLMLEFVQLVFPVNVNNCIIFKVVAFYFKKTL